MSSSGSGLGLEPSVSIDEEARMLIPMPAVSRRSRSPEQPAVPGVAEVHDGGARPPVPRAEGELELDHSGLGGQWPPG